MYSSPYTAAKVLVMKSLHLEEGVVTEEECEEINKEGYTTMQVSLLSLVLCTKSDEQYKVAIKTLKVYPFQLMKLTSRYLPGKHVYTYTIVDMPQIILHNCQLSRIIRDIHGFSNGNVSRMIGGMSWT